MSLKLLLILSGGLETLVGALALISPGLVVSVLLGGQADTLALVVARLFGAAALALGLACLKSRDNVESLAGLAIAYAITSYNVVAAVVIIWAAAGLQVGGALLWAAGIGHAVLSLLFIHALTGLGTHQR